MEPVGPAQPRPEVDFDAAYRQSPPWEIGRPQPAIVSHAASGAITGPVLDVGCGTGENAIHLARLGHEVVAVDSSSAAIEEAREKARHRGVEIGFEVGDAFDLVSLGRPFMTVLDSGLLHIIGDKTRYAEQLAWVAEPGGSLVLLEISDLAEIPYPKISETEIRQTFPAPRWEIEELAGASFDTRLGQFPAWLGIVRRTKS